MFEVELTNYMNIHKLCMRFVHKKRFNYGMCSRFYNAIHLYKAVVHMQHVRKLYTGTLSAVRTDGMMSDWFSSILESGKAARSPLIYSLFLWTTSWKEQFIADLLEQRWAINVH